MDRLTLILDIVGAALLVVAAFLVADALGFAAAGIAALVLSWRIDQ